MPGDHDLSVAAAPDIVTPAAPEEDPTEGLQLTLEVTAFHTSSIHIYV
jgi:hypothetical protein